MNSTIVFFGDSITAGNNTRSNALGVGYVSMLSTMLQNDPQFTQAHIINAGVNGHTVQDLLHRYKQDVVSVNPDTILIKIGINDAYQDYMSGEQDAKLELYENDYQRLISKLKSEVDGVDIRLITPYYISDTGDEALYRRIADYIRVVYRLGEEFDLPVLDIQQAFDDAVLEKPALSWAADQIHPIPEGHQLIARHVFEFLKQG